MIMGTDPGSLILGTCSTHHCAEPVSLFRNMLSGHQCAEPTSLILSERQ
jgi:hypothetical protein